MQFVLNFKTRNCHNFFLGEPCENGTNNSAGRGDRDSRDYYDSLKMPKKDELVFVSTWLPYRSWIQTRCPRRSLVTPAVKQVLYRALSADVVLALMASTLVQHWMNVLPSNFTTKLLRVAALWYRIWRRHNARHTLKRFVH